MSTRQVRSQKRGHRSIRIRYSRTPSEMSYSEGEVLSDTEDDAIYDVQKKIKKSFVSMPSESNDNTYQKDDNLLQLTESTLASVNVHNNCQNSNSLQSIDTSDTQSIEMKIMDEWSRRTSLSKADSTQKPQSLLINSVVSHCNSTTLGSIKVIFVSI